MIHITSKILKLSIYKLCLQISKEGRKEKRKRYKAKKEKNSLEKWSKYMNRQFKIFYIIR